jgi:hypothetical protein
MTADDMEMRTDSHALYGVSLRLVAERIPGEALGLLRTLHQMYGPHVHDGQACCLGTLLAHTPASPLATPEAGTVSAILAAGYDLTIEAADDDRHEVVVWLSYPAQPPTETLSFWATPGTLGQRLEQARLFAKAFPAGKQASA